LAWLELRETDELEVVRIFIDIVVSKPLPPLESRYAQVGRELDAMAGETARGREKGERAMSTACASNQK